MGKNKAIIILGIGVLVAVLAGLLTHSWLQRRGNAQVAAGATQSVTVAATDLPWGTVIAPGMTKAVPFLKQTAPSGSFSNPAQLEGRSLLYPAKANEPIFESQLAPTTAKGGGIAAVIGPQKRAMAVKVDKVIGVSGFIHPGDRVDVIATFNQIDRTLGPITKTVIENVLVLATGSDTEKSDKSEKSAPVDVITLEVSIQEGEKLALAATEGKLQLALRNLADAKDVNTKGTTIQALLSSLGGMAAPEKTGPVAGAIRPVSEPSHRAPQAVFTIEGASVSGSAPQKGE
jgi:pilus assembly protein CpaB